MEAQLRKLWVRRKSFGKKTEKPDRSEAPPLPSKTGFELNTSYEAHVYGPPPQIGTLPIKPSEWRKPKKAVGHTKTQSAGVQPSKFRVDQDVHSRSRSSTGIQPMLVGVSRPATSGSTHIAIAHAATDAPAGKSMQTVNRSQSMQSTNPSEKRKYTNKRHVDIMSFIAESSKQPEGYNEDVAERNLELLALAVENSKLTYVPNSKYQEEVANRNSLAVAARRMNGTALRTVPENPRLNKKDVSVTGPQDILDPVLTVPTTATHYGYQHQPSGPPVVSTPRSLQNTAIAHHSRNASINSKTSAPLSPIPQEDIDGMPTEFPTNPFSAQGQRRDALDVPSAITRYPSLNTKDAIPRTFSRESPNANGIKSAPRANQGRPLTNGALKDHGNPITEEFKHSRDFSYDRSLMDLTVEDPDSVSPSPATDYAETPILSHATTDVLSPLRAQLIDGNMYNYQDTSDHETVDASTIFTGEHMSQQSSDGGSRMSLPPPNKRSYSGFSNSSSQYLEQQPLSFSRVTMVSVTPPTVRASDDSRPKMRDSVTASSHNTADSFHPPLRVNEQLQAFHEDTPPKHQNGMRTTENIGSKQTPQTLYTSPESLNSADFKNPTQSFGVLARDFAATPSRPQQPPRQSLQQDSSSQPHQVRRAQPTKSVAFKKQPNNTPGSKQPAITRSELDYEGPQIDHVDTPKKELFAASFDEDEYARKQMQAHAALARLQLSLEESLDMPPGRPDSHTQRHVAAQVLGKNDVDDGKKTSTIPASMYAKVKTSRPFTVNEPGNDASMSNAYNMQSTSFHSAVTRPFPSDSTSLSRSHASRTAPPGPPRSQYYLPVLLPATRAAISNSYPTSVSPSETSLSSFPMPTASELASPARDTYHQSVDEQPSSRPQTSRMHSSKASIHSVANSTASVYSIPRHMVPGRSSSLRDNFDEESEW